MEKYGKHPLSIKDIDIKFDELKKHFEHIEDEHKKWIVKDDNRKIIDDLLDGKVGKPLSSKDLEEAYKDGKLILRN